ncbi:HIT family protein [Micromonospora pisi]|uniref:HIT family protein n=1 Tax=Micromonospora pisi TaxID=589240 RepID=UPI001B872EA3|nr:HIT family protein [Micromonospora pisi]
MAVPDECVFCAIVAGTEPATVVHRWPDALAIVPHGPVVAGHLLVIPTVHVRDHTTDPSVTAVVMGRAAEIAPHPSNLIANAGREATQSVFHLHVHVVPRAAGDGLALPWYSGRSGRRSLP